MKVAYITTRFPGLAETFTCTDIRVLRESGVEVSVHTMRPPKDDPVRLLKERRLSTLPVDQGTMGAHLRGLALSVGRPRLLLGFLCWLVASTWRRPVQLLIGLLLVPRSVGILRSLERERPDVVHLFWGHYPCMVGYLVLETMPDVTVSLFLGAYDLMRAFGGTASVARRAHLVSTHARCNLPSIEALGVPAERIHLAYRGIDLTAFDVGNADKIERRIVSAGRLDVGKGMDDVLRTFRDVHTRWPDSSLRVIGSGPERERLLHLAGALGIDGAVTFLGHIPQADLATELLAAEVFLFMSWEDSERLPNVVKEAMACRCVCVVTVTPGMHELLEHGRQGFHVTRGDVGRAAAWIDDIFSGRIDRAAVRQAAAAHVANRFDVLKTMQSYRRRWQQTLSWRSSMPGQAPDVHRPSAVSAEEGA